MSQIEMIKELQSKGLGPVAIAERLKINRKTVSKYMAMEEFEEQKPMNKEERPSKLDPFKPLIREWLEEDRKNRYKQRHTAMRIHKRLMEECEDYDASYPLVQRYVKRLRDQRYEEGTQELVWHPGEAQATSAKRISTTEAAKRKPTSIFASAFRIATPRTCSFSAERQRNAWLRGCRTSFTGWEVCRPVSYLITPAASDGASATMCRWRSFSCGSRRTMGLR